LVREIELRDVISALGAAAVLPLIIKGAHLAHNHYTRPSLRPRCDTDIFVAASAWPQGARVLNDIGYNAPPQFAGDLVTTQACFVKERSGLRHIIDLHWRIANPHPFRAVLEYDELLTPSEPIPALGPQARGLSRVHAQLLACVHRVAHHGDSNRLIWLRDIHQLAQVMTEVDWTQFTALAQQRGVASVCSRSLLLSALRFGTAIPADVLVSLGSRSDEPTRAYLVTHRLRVALIAQDLRSLKGFRQRARFLLQHAFPNARYMRNVYAPGSRAPLGVLYAWRAIRGARKWLLRNV
jgi:hypothetical protein